MFKCNADITKNRLYIIFKGRLEIDEVNTAGVFIINEAKKLKPGFGIISDIADYIPTSEEGRLAMQKIMKTLKDMNLGHVVRIVRKDKVVQSFQWQRTSKAVGYIADEVGTIEEAEKHLDNLENK